LKVAYWQISAGFYGRDYSEVFLKHGIAFVGGENKIATMNKVKRGDRMILKRGKSRILAVGEVVARNGVHIGNGNKDWLRDFDGWELPAFAYVDWRKPRTPKSVNGLNMGTIQRLGSLSLQKVAEQILNLRPLKVDREPKATEKVGDDKILEFLVTEGLRPGAAEDLTAALRRVRTLARYYRAECQWADIREHETRTFLIMPLLLALGWAEQQMKIELAAPGGRVDIAFFPKPFSQCRKEQCVLILEAKGFSQGLDYAHHQAKEYAKAFPHSKAVVTSNGFCYKVYPRHGKTFSDEPAAYLNLLDPRDRYPVDPTVGGCLDALWYLLPRVRR
jgi:hypothetical protein